jgi:hypothetical protein
VKKKALCSKRNDVALLARALCSKRNDVALLAQALCSKRNDVALLAQTLCSKRNDVALLARTLCSKRNDVALLAQTLCSKRNDVALLAQTLCSKRNDVALLAQALSPLLGLPDEEGHDVAPVADPLARDGGEGRVSLQGREDGLHVDEGVGDGSREVRGNADAGQEAPWRGPGRICPLTQGRDQG